MKLILVGVVLLGVALGVASGASTTCNCGWVNKGRIVGGSETPKNAYPWMVALWDIHQNFQFCGGTIITPWHVVTAGHCVERRSAGRTNIIVGAHTIRDQYQSKHDGQQLPVDRLILHFAYSDYDNGNYIKNDVGLVVLARQITFNQNVGPACFPTGQASLTGRIVKSMGWGNTNEGGTPAERLREVDLPVISFDQCTKSYPKLARPQQNLCTNAKKKDSCQGDSGGPVVYLDPETNRYTLVGITSFGWGCARPGFPGANADAGYFAEWIEQQVSKTKSNTQTCINSQASNSSSSSGAWSLEQCEKKCIDQCRNDSKRLFL